MKLAKFDIKFWVLVMVMAIALPSLAQKEANNWYFGNKAAFHFNTPSGNPVAVSGSQMNTLEGCSSISDATSGALLFYTDGQTVYTSTHAIMSGGTGLLGDNSSSHSSVVVPFPGNKNKYYIFTVPTNPSIGAKYSVVDMTLNSGAGGVVLTQKNVQLAQSATNTTPFVVADKCAAIGHSNGRDYWVVVQHNTTWSFYAYLVTSTGVSNTPVISTVTPMPITSTRISHYGCMKISPDGTRLAAAYPSYFGVWDFDTRNGQVSNQLSCSPTISGRPYGIEFSMDSKLLYVNHSGVHQYDISQTTAAAVVTSGTTVSKAGYNQQGQLQLGPDEKLYWSHYIWTTGTSIISRIDSPNVSGTGCAFRDTGVVLTSGSVKRLGLPTFIQSFFNTTVLKVDDACDSQYVKIAVKDTSAVDSVQYFYGDTGSTHTSSWNKLDSHLYSGPGKYEVIAHAYYYDSKNKKVVIDTLRDTIEILQIPKVVLPGDTTICSADSIQGLILNPTWSKPYQLFWQDSSQNEWYTIDSTGKYYMWAQNRCGIGSDTLVVDSLFKRDVDLGNDTVFCLGDSIGFDISDTSATYLWSTGATTPKIFVDTTHLQLWARSTNFCGTFGDTVEVIAIDPPVVDVTTDTGFCTSVQRNLWVGEKTRSTYSSYYWNGSLGGYQKLIFNTGWYEILETNKCGSDMDSIWVQRDFPINPYLGQDTILCIGDSIRLDPQTFSADVSWNGNPQLTDTALTVTSAGTYWIYAENYCGIFSDTIVIDERDVPVVSLPNDSIICAGDSMTLEVKFPHATYRWNTGSTVSRIWAKTTGTFWVETKTECGVDFDSVKVEVDNPPSVSLPLDTILCDDDQIDIEATGQFIRSYAWSTGNTNMRQNIAKAGTYSITVTNDCGTATDDIVIEQWKSAEPDLGMDTVICDGDGIELRTHIDPAILAYSTVTWDGKYEAEEFYVERGRSYRVDVNNICGVGRDTIRVELQKRPYIPRLGDTVVCDNVIRYDFTELGYDLLWSNGVRGSKIEIKEAGEYAVEIFDNLGCFNAQRFEVTQCASNMWIPTAFTPNGDGTNEFFRVYKDGLTYFQIEIYDRWNKMVFLTNNIEEGWDGTLSNQGTERCIQGQYVYKVSFIEEENNQLQVVTGEFSLLR